MTQRTRRRQTDHGPSSAARQSLYRRLTNPFENLRVFSDDQVAHLHETALGILEDAGIRVLLPDARKRFAAAGAIVDSESEIVRIGRDLVSAALRTAPKNIEVRASRSDRNLTIGGRNTAVVPVSGPPNVTDTIRGRRPGTLDDLRDFIRLSEYFDVVHMLGPSVEPQDVSPEFRHLAMMHAQLTLSNKIPFIYSRGSPQVEDCFEMVRLALGIKAEEFSQQVVCYTNINTNSPRQLDIPMAQGIIDFAAAGQMSIITPFTLSGAMAPVTISGALTLAHAEALAGITLAQLVGQGAPVVYGSFTSNVDMRSGSPAFGTPEYVKAAFGAGQLARHIGLPWRSSNATASNAADEQATYESAMSLWGALLGGCNVLIHGAGWLEGGLAASFEKFIIDIELLQMFGEIFQPLAATDDDIGRSAIDEVPPGGHFFSTAHTMQRYKEAFYSPLVSDGSNFGLWTERGAKTAAQRSTEIWQRVLREFLPPARDEGISEALGAFLRVRREQGGASPVS
jgi:trimethylamine---corrinoid protein Co-methyltransferase